MEAKRIIEGEPPPKNGKDRCQDWTLNCVVALEVAEILEPGCAEVVGDSVGRSAGDVRARTGDRWVQG